VEEANEVLVKLELELETELMEMDDVVLALALVLVLVLGLMLDEEGDEMNVVAVKEGTVMAELVGV
jgi:hypothetical protein